MPKWTTTEIVQGYLLGQAVYSLHKAGVFEAFESWRSAKNVARALQVDWQLLVHVITFVDKTTDLFEHKGMDLLRLNPTYRAYSKMGFQLDGLLGAYGECAKHAWATIRSPRTGSNHVNYHKLARGFERLESPQYPSPIGEVCQALGIDTIVDLGCGPGTLLVEFAKGGNQRRGWGIDKNHKLCGVARRRLREIEALDRFKIVNADVRLLNQSIQETERASVQAIHAGSLLNEFFARTSSAIGFLRSLRRLFPGRLLLVDDYYGKLMNKEAGPDHYRQTLLQDFVQVISGQGLPPSTLGEWEVVYQSAGCSVIREYAGEANGMTWFYHVVQM